MSDMEQDGNAWNDPTGCAKCHATMGIRDGCDPTDICDNYAQDEVPRLRDALCTAEQRVAGLAALVERQRAGIEQAGLFANAQCGWDKARALQHELDALLTLTPEQALVEQQEGK